MPHARAAGLQAEHRPRVLAGLDIRMEIRATELVMIRERVFPALELDVLHRFPIMM